MRRDRHDRRWTDSLRFASRYGRGQCDGRRGRIRRRSARLFYKLQALPCELADRHATACFHVVRTPGMLQHSQTRSGPRYIRAGVYVCVYVCPVSYINAPGAVRGSETREVGSGAARGGRGKLPPYGWTSKNYATER